MPPCLPDKLSTVKEEASEEGKKKRAAQFWYQPTAQSNTDASVSRQSSPTNTALALRCTHVEEGDAKTPLQHPFMLNTAHDTLN